MKKRTVGIGCLLSALWITAMAREGLQLHVSFSPERQLLGLEVAPTVVLVNNSKQTIQVPAERFIVGVVRFVVPDERKITIEWGGTCGGTVQWVPLAPGERMSYSPPFETRCCKAGTYSVKAVYDDSRFSPPARQALRLESNEVSLVYEQPSGADLQAFQAVVKDIERQSASPTPCLAAYVGRYFSIHPEFLNNFPTSTYAGYALRAPAVSFGCGTYDCFDNPEEILRKECDRGGGDKPTQECMQKEREKMRAYANAAGPFLEAHPDFFDAPRIRRQYAYCLAFTGRVDEALDQVCILAKGEGELGKEAKSFLEKRTARKSTR